MRKIIYYAYAGMLLLATTACFKKDDYSVPSETLTGSIIDSTTGMPIQTEQGSGIRIKLDELSWSANPVPLYFWVKQDGTFNNSRLFPGHYRITPVDGPFVPLIRQDGNGDTTVNNSQTVDISGVTQVTFTVVPFLKVEWVGDPVVNPDSTVSVNIRFTRGTSDPAYQFNVTDAYLFVCEEPYIGNNNFNNKLSTQATYSGEAGNALLGQTITLRSKAPLPAGRTWYLRVGARTADNIQKRYNYTDVKTVNMP
ncbi:DUF3823 domain-containing protein [Compostibacter hankyongensis]|uniref:DUF3823 domain-containing protein n=1 Tax=Compostibacter hankyongensis TaxID=1007089 RepID=A0ABP8G183_9BACT